MSEYVVELRDAIEKFTPELEKMSDEATRMRPGPGKWCPREIIGHLIDSASNNHQRFVRATTSTSWRGDPFPEASRQASTTSWRTTSRT